MQQWHEPQAGFRYQTRQLELAANTQLERLTACGVDAQVFADEADPAFFIGLAIHAGIDSGISAEGNINMLQRLIQHRPAKLGELLTARGLIQSVTPVPRGLRAHTDVWFEDAAGERVISCPRTSLKPRPNTQTATVVCDKPQLVVDDLAKLSLARRYQLTPERVKAYSAEGNSIHYEQEAAERAGFRAPPIGGSMGVHYLTAQMWRDRRPASFDALIHFRRPIFRDEALQVGAIEDGLNWRSLGLLKLRMANADFATAAEPTGEAVVKVGTELALQSYTGA